MGGGDRKEIWHKGSLGHEDDARTSNTVHSTRIAQRKRAMPHSNESTRFFSMASSAMEGTTETKFGTKVS